MIRLRCVPPTIRATAAVAALLLALLVPDAVAQESAMRARPSPPSTEATLGVEDAIRIALERNHRIRIARINAEIARNRTGYGTAGFLPTLDASGSVSLAESRQETNSPFSFGNSNTAGWSGQLALNWTLFDGFRMFAEARRYDELAELGTQQARAAIEQTVVSVLRSYLQSVQQQQLLGVLEEALAISRLRFERAGVRRDLGGSVSDYLNAQIAFHNDSSAVLSQRLALEIAQRELNLELGREATTPLRVADEPVPEALLPDLDELIAMALERNADLRTAEQTLRAAESSVRVSRSAFFPRLSLFANYGYSDRTVASSSPRFTEDIRTQSADAAVGLNLSLNLFNGFRSATDTEQAELERRTSAIALEETQMRIEGLLREQYLTMETRKLTLALEEANLTAARRNLDLQLERFETATVTSLEFRDAQLQYVRAEIAVIVARFQVRISRLELQRLAGEIRI
ncbi:MAG: TolC family protein [Bacteroidetes bacterium]|nr:TolC family protein [Bacteroidota bacterium]